MSVPVSIIVPCYNEAGTIELLLKAIQQQTFARSAFEVVLADGMSTDGTREAIDRFRQKHPDLTIRLVDNPKRVIPAALNRALEQARGDVIIRLDAHSIPQPDYLERCVGLLAATGAANAGGVWDIRPSGEGWLARAIAVAAAHPLGAGGARYRTGGRPGEVDTVPFGAFRREWVERVGRFNERLHTNEDYEFNVRLRKAGGKIWFDPSIRSTYFARGDLASLGRQYGRYGFWKARMLADHLDTLRWRQALPPLFVLSLLILVILVPFWRAAILLLGVELAVYALALLAAGLQAAIRRRDAMLFVGLPLAIGTMHVSWGGAFLWGLCRWLTGGSYESR